MSAAVKRRPGTPLPWEAYCVNYRNAITASGRVFAEVRGSDFRRDEQDTKYLAHAAMAYPRLVEALLTNLHISGRISRSGPVALLDEMRRIEDAASNLLRELGEA